MSTRNILLAVFVVLTSSLSTYCVYDTFFTRSNVCSTNCRFDIPGRSKIHCILQCNDDPNCLFSAWDSNLGLCRLCESVTTETNCGVAASPGYLKKALECQNGGTFNDSQWRCSCAVGFTGDLCQRPIYDCSEGFHLNYPSGVYQIQPPLATSPFSVNCEMVYGGKTYIAWRDGSALHFNRTWEEYRNGFGNVLGDFWLGLQHIYLLTNSGLDNELQVEIQNSSSFYFQQYYYNFRISDESRYYQLLFDSTGTNSHAQHVLGDSLSPALGSFFSTYNADHDGDVTENCALRHHSGWWFPSTCSLTEGNPFGKLVRPVDGLWSGNPEDAFWLTHYGNRAPFKISMWLVSA